jgi:ketosteroid isomerase-like protein
MRSKSTISAILVLLGCLAVQPGNVYAQDHEAMIAAAEGMDAAFVAAFNSGDTDALADLYWNSPDLVSFPPGSMADVGYEAVTMGWKSFVESVPGAKLVLRDATNIVAGEYVVTFGYFDLTMPGPDGSSTTMNGRFTDLKAERDGKWVYVHDHASVPLPPPPTQE